MANQTDIVDLIAAIDGRLKTVHTQSLDLSFNELLDMRVNNELDISPDFQRLFRWSEGAQSRFIESLLLEMPVPPIYVIEQDEGRYTLIDGLQRISSYLHLRGALDASHLDPPVHSGEKLILTECDIVEELNDRTFDDLGTALQIRLKRAFVRVEVVRKATDPRFKYHMFKRLNTGGQALTPQQVRNCTIRLLDPRFSDFTIELSKSPAFADCIETLTQDQMLGAFDQELVLRFFAIKNYRGKFKHDVDDFLDKYMEAVSDNSKSTHFDYDAERLQFVKTFELLDRTLGKEAFSSVNPKTNQITRSFRVYHFEAFTVGVQAILDRIDLQDAGQLNRLGKIFREIKSDPTFIDLTTGGGKNSPGVLKKRIEFVEARVPDGL